MSSPSTPSPAAHHFARLCQHSGRGTGGHLVLFWAMLSPHLAITSPANSSHRASPRRSDILPASSSSLLQVVRVGQRASQGGRFPPAHPVDPLHPAGVFLGIYADTSGRGGVCQAISGRRGSSVRFKVSGFSARLYRSKYQVFIFSEGLIRAMPVHRGNDNCT